MVQKWQEVRGGWGRRAKGVWSHRNEEEKEIKVGRWDGCEEGVGGCG